jgi:hypothetical protein
MIPVRMGNVSRDDPFQASNQGTARGLATIAAISACVSRKSDSSAATAAGCSTGMSLVGILDNLSMAGERFDRILKKADQRDANLKSGTRQAQKSWLGLMIYCMERSSL